MFNISLIYILYRIIIIYTNKYKYLIQHLIKALKIIRKHLAKKAKSNPNNI